MESAPVPATKGKSSEYDLRAALGLVLPLSYVAVILAYGYFVPSRFLLAFAYSLFIYPIFMFVVAPLIIFLRKRHGWWIYEILAVGATGGIVVIGFGIILFLAVLTASP